MKRHTDEARVIAQRIREQVALLSSPGTRTPALSELCALSKSEGNRKEIDRLLPNRKVLFCALSAQQPKTRKNAARLLGALAHAGDDEVLIAALAAEETRFVRPSIILALGALNTPKTQTYLKTLPIPEGEDKHDQEEAAAIRTALSRTTPITRHPFTGLTGPARIELMAPAGFGPLLAAELKELGLPTPRRVFPDGVRLETQDLSKLYRARCFAEALFPLAQDIQCAVSDPAKAGQAVAAAVRGPLMQLVSSSHAGEPPYAYRVECRFETDRGGFARAFAARLDGGGTHFYNSPSQYELEIRVEPGALGRLNALLKLYTYRDQRFEYRKHRLSASIHPAIAAALCRYSLEFCEPGKPLRVLDPCCGSGTLLIERGLLSPCAALTGVDIAKNAIDMAKENGHLAHSPARFLQKDCLAFTADAPFDLVISNLPFGSRVGTHKDNERLYAGLVEKLPEWLAPGGTAILYTMEYTLLKRCLALQQSLVPAGKARTQAGGLMPFVVAIKKRK